MPSSVELASKGIPYIYDVQYDEFFPITQEEIELLLTINQYYGRMVELFTEYQPLASSLERQAKKGVRNLSKKLLALHLQCKEEVNKLNKPRRNK